MPKRKDKGAEVTGAKKSRQMAPTPPGSAKPAAPAKPEKPDKGKRKRDKGDKHVKVVRDSFTMPETDYAMIDELKARCIRLGVPMKKSELLRAGLSALVQMDDSVLREKLDGLERVKTGRPKQGK